MDYSRHQPYRIWISWAIRIMILCVVVQLGARQAMAACATVKMEIVQEVTLEQQTFDAHMRIRNDVESLTLNNVNIEVGFADAEGNTVLATSDPNSQDTNVMFFIQVDSMSGIADVSGSGVVSPSSVADIHWIIIPALRAGGAKPEGTLYYVGAKLSYTMGETPYVTEVTPDYIYVKPMPDLALDYFLPSQVYGDDAFTTNVEASVPFSLGLRVKNIGAGAAYNLKIDTAQPEITNNANGLLITYEILNGEVNGQSAPNTLLADFGTVNPGAAIAARWEMICSLSGTFRQFTASVSHSDELGGQLTALIQASNIWTHVLVRDVMVDMPGRDRVRDYLAADGYVYESEGLDSPVAYKDEEDAQLQTAGSNQNLTISTPSWGFIYVKLPVATNEVLASVVRSDGKQIPSDNAWISKERKLVPEEGWNFYFNLFDVDAGDCFYRINYASDTPSSNHPPVLADVAPVVVIAGQAVGINMHASDEDGTVPELSATNLPSGAQFSDGQNGIGFFSWTPSSNQVDSYSVSFTASDGELTDTKSVEITVMAATAGGPAPEWWTQRNVLQTGQGTNDFAVVNQGQLKHIAAMAWQELNALEGGAGFSLSFSNADNYVAVNLGQLKRVAKPFYDRLYTSYPWGVGTNGNNAIVNIGQVKNVFSLDPTRDSDGDGMPDWWETHYNLNPSNPSDATADPDNDAWINRDEYLRHTNPYVPDE